MFQGEGVGLLPSFLPWQSCGCQVRSLGPSVKCGHQRASPQDSTWTAQKQWMDACAETLSAQTLSGGFLPVPPSLQGWPPEPFILTKLS